MQKFENADWMAAALKFNFNAVLFSLVFVRLRKRVFFSLVLERNIIGLMRFTVSTEVIVHGLPKCLILLGKNNLPVTK